MGFLGIGKLGCWYLEKLQIWELHIAYYNTYKPVQNACDSLYLVLYTYTYIYENCSNLHENTVALGKLC